MSREETVKATFGGSGTADTPPCYSSSPYLATNSIENQNGKKLSDGQQVSNESAFLKPKTAVYPERQAVNDRNGNDSTTMDVFAVAIPAEVLETPPLQPAVVSDSRPTDENFRRAVEEAVRQEMIRNWAAAETPVVVVQPQDSSTTPMPFFANKKKYCIPCVILPLVMMTAIIIALVVAFTMSGGKAQSETNNQLNNEITRVPNSTGQANASHGAIATNATGQVTTTNATSQVTTTNASDPAVPTSARYRTIPNGVVLQQVIDAYLSNDVNRKAEVLRTYGSPIGSWNVSLVTDFSEAFSSYRNELNSLFNEDISQWDTSSATDMSSMFYGASSFNRDLSNWDTSHVTDMHNMFHGASSFNSDLCKWVTSQVTNMYWMFDDASSFNSDLSKWNTSKVIDMSGMFLRAPNFSADLSQWDTSQVTDMASMFNGASSFNADLSQWDTGRVTNTASMFSGASNLNADLDGWDVSAVTNYMFSMFYGASKFSSCLCSWRFKLQGKSIDVHGMFAGTNCPYTSDPDLFDLQTTFCCACGAT